MGLTELPIADGRSETIEVCALTELKMLILGREEPGEWKDGEYVPTTIANQLTTLPDELLALVNLRSIVMESSDRFHVDVARERTEFCRR